MVILMIDRRLKELCHQEVRAVNISPVSPREGMVLYGAEFAHSSSLHTELHPPVVCTRERARWLVLKIREATQTGGVGTN